MIIKAVKLYENGFMTQAFAFGGENMQISLLKDDGIEVIDGKVDLEKYLWKE